MGICPAYTDSVSSPEHGTAMHFNGDWVLVVKVYGFRCANIQRAAVQFARTTSPAGSSVVLLLELGFSSLNDNGCQVANLYYEDSLCGKYKVLALLNGKRRAMRLSVLLLTVFLRLNKSVDLLWMKNHPPTLFG